ncbi:MAG: hypothetical protein U5R14_10695 [Gemmatimonadota bacterium]|nr:hypothetical protein [Gemmatimonadota bacterium]
MRSGLTELEPVVALAHRAGAAILEVYARDDADVTLKDDRTPLTEADRASHRVIEHGLRALTPDVPVISEEGAAPDASGLRGRSHLLARRSARRHEGVHQADG